MMGPVETEMRANYRDVRARINGVVPTNTVLQIQRLEATIDELHHIIAEKVAEAEKTQVEITVLRAILKPVHIREPSPLRRLAKEVAELHDIGLGQLMGESRTKSIVMARHEFCYRAYSETNKSLSEIGRFLNRDHTTVQNAIRRWAEILEQA